MTEAAWGCALGWGCSQEQSMDAVTMGPWGKGGQEGTEGETLNREMADRESTAHSSPFTAQGQAIESFWENMTSLSLTVCCPMPTCQSAL